MPVSTGSGSTSPATVILGIAGSGEILQAAENTPGVTGWDPADVVGAQIGALVDDEHQDTVKELLEAIGTTHERTALLGLLAGDGRVLDAVVTMQPMRGGNGSPAGLMTLRVATPEPERFTDPAVMRWAMLDDSLTRIGATLDLDQVARELANVVVPHFSNACGVLVQESIMAADEFPTHTVDGTAVLRRVAVTRDDGNPRWNSAFPTGEVLTYPPGTPYARCMESGEPVLEPHLDTAAAQKIAKSWRRKPVAGLLDSVSMVLLPLLARGVTLGFIVCTRDPHQRRFDRYDVEIGMEFAARAAMFIENARRYSRERATALTLQRSMLPIGLSAPASVEIQHRYLPGNQLIEVGGDWYESIAMPGGRVALIVGDVAGHGVRAAVTMGRLRTALRTIVNLELPPAAALQQLDTLMREMGEPEPAFATCAYAVYDATTGEVEIASAGHLPPLLLSPDGTAEFLDVPPAPPLGIGDGVVESRSFTIDDGSLLVLYTDGLVENRGQDIDDGLTRLRGVFGPDALTRPMEDLAKATLDSAYADHDRDDIAVLIARLRRLPARDVRSWSLREAPTAVREARAKVRGALAEWDLEELCFATELVVSELVTNALRYGPGDVRLRLLRDRTLVFEVHDAGEALPRARQAAPDDEGGRGLQVVQRLARRWGARPTSAGKVVWCELDIPGVSDAPAGSWPGEGHHRPATTFVADES